MSAQAKISSWQRVRKSAISISNLCAAEYSRDDSRMPTTNRQSNSTYRFSCSTKTETRPEPDWRPSPTAKCSKPMTAEYIAFMACLPDTTKSALETSRAEAWRQTAEAITSELF